MPKSIVDPEYSNEGIKSWGNLLCYDVHMYIAGDYNGSQSIFALAFCLYFYVLAMVNNFMNFNIVVISIITIILGFDIIKKIMGNCSTMYIIIFELILALTFATPIVYICNATGAFPKNKDTVGEITKAKKNVQGNYVQNNNQPGETNFIEGTSNPMKCKVYKNGQIIQ
jgi:hypothetical protein